MGAGASAASKIVAVIKEGSDEDEDASAGVFDRQRSIKANMEFGGEFGNFVAPGTEVSLPDTSLISQDNIRKLIKLEYQRKAFSSFMTQYYKELNAQEYLTHCINVEKFLVQTNRSKARADLMTLLAHYEKRSNSKMASNPKHPSVVIFRTMESEDKDIKDLTDEELQTLMLKSQNDIIGMLSPLFAQFMYSTEYEKMLESTPAGVEKPSSDRRYQSSRYSSIRPDRRNTTIVPSDHDPGDAP